MELKKYEQPNLRIKICHCDAILSSIPTVKDGWDDLGNNLY